MLSFIHKIDMSVFANMLGYKGGEDEQEYQGTGNSIFLSCR